MKVLALIGTGIKTVSHITEEAKGYITSCDKVLYLINEPLLESYLIKYAKCAESLDPIYFKSETRKFSYENISNYICSEVEKVNSLCVVIYGHPCLFSSPGLLALSKSNELKELKTIICPAVSSLDCLYSDLRFDPAVGGMQLFDATEYILYDKFIEKSSHLLIFQIGMVGNLGLPTNEVNIGAIRLIKNKLVSVYKKNKIAILYEAALYPGTEPKIIKFELENLEKQSWTTISTLYIPPEKAREEVNIEALNILVNRVSG